jgi:hypothetical protein
MGTALDALTSASQPLTARRPAASNLPTFELPPPANFQLATTNSHAKFPSPATNLHPGSHVSVGNLLTPPSTNPSGVSISDAPDVPPYSSGIWQQSQNSYSYAPSQPSWSQSSVGLFPPPRGGTLGRPDANPPVTEGMSQSYDLHQLPPFQQSHGIPVSTPATANPILQHPPHHQQQQAMAHAMINAQGLPTTSAPSPHHMGATDPYGNTSHSAPLYGASPHPATPSPYRPPYGGPQSGLGIHAPPRMPPGSSQSPPMQPPHLGYTRPPWPSYSLPAMAGPIMTNVHNPSGQMSLMGNMPTGFLPAFSSGHLANMQHMYSGHAPHHQGHGQPAPLNDRPFKCDQCPQSFNRNHDLKRHKRIHLSVKPFPCNHCEKSFSRKDALKVKPFPPPFGPGPVGIG